MKEGKQAKEGMMVSFCTKMKTFWCVGEGSNRRNQGKEGMIVSFCSEMKTFLSV